MNVIKEDLRGHLFGSTDYLDNDEAINPVGEKVSQDLLKLKKVNI
jgi:hypothetical protein